MNYKRIVPNTISGISLVLGVFSIFYTQEQNYFMAAICIILSVVADSLDGRAARALGVQGPFGVEMDSLCDLGAFGVAPAILIYQFALTDLGWWGKIIAGLYTFFGAMRLARFNVNTSVVHGYLVAGIMTLAVALILYSNVKFPDFKGKGNPMYRYPVILAVLIGAYLLWQKPSGWPFVGMFTYFVAGVINAVYCLLFVKEEAN